MVRIGRPPKNPDERRTVEVRLYITHTEHLWLLDTYPGRSAAEATRALLKDARDRGAAWLQDKHAALVAEADAIAAKARAWSEAEKEAAMVQEHERRQEDARAEATRIQATQRRQEDLSIQSWGPRVRADPTILAEAVQDTCKKAGLDKELDADRVKARLEERVARLAGYEKETRR